MWLISEMLIKFTCGLIIIHFTKITSVKFFEKCLSTKSYRIFQVKSDWLMDLTHRPMRLQEGGVESEVGTQASSLLCESICSKCLFFSFSTATLC